MQGGVETDEGVPEKHIVIAFGLSYFNCLFRSHYSPTVLDVGLSEVSHFTNIYMYC